MEPSFEDLSYSDSNQCLDAEADSLLPRFSYTGSKWQKRLLAGTRLKTALMSSTCIRIQYRRHFTYFLILLLLLVGVLLTSTELPDRAGFEWASPHQICQNSKAKFDNIRQLAEKTAGLPAGYGFLKKQLHEYNAIRLSAILFYHGIDVEPRRPLWPSGCDAAKVSESLSKIVCDIPRPLTVKECLNTNFAQDVLLFFGGIKKCKKTTVEPRCYEKFDNATQVELHSLERERQQWEHDIQNEIQIQSKNRPVLKIEEDLSAVMGRLLFHVNIASNMYILYNIGTIWIGKPLKAFKPGKMAQFSGATLGLTRITFTVVLLTFLFLYDRLFSLLTVRKTRSFLANMFTDPCWVDPDFMQERVSILAGTCNKVYDLEVQSLSLTRSMQNLYQDIRLFGLCEVGGKRWGHPYLDNIRRLVSKYRNFKYRNPAVCDFALLDMKTSSPPAQGSTSIIASLVGSGILPELTLKVILSNIIVHGIGFVEPMSLHHGRVELIVIQDLLPEEEQLIRRFASDQHFLPLIANILLLVVNVSLFIYAFSSSLRA